MKRQARQRAPKTGANMETRKPKTRFSEEEKAAALETVNLCGGNVAEASRLTGITAETIYTWAKGHCVDEKVFADFTTKKTGRMTAKMRALADRLADEMMSEGAIATARYGELNAAFGTIFDKLRLVDGKATAISLSLTDESMKAEAQIVFKDYVKHLNGDQAAALALMSEDFPEMASTLVQ